MNPSQLTTRLAELEAKVLDPILFGHAVRDPETGQWVDSEDGSPITPGRVAGGLAAGGAVYGGFKAAPMVQNRLSGLRATVPGFTGKSGIGQYAAAAADVTKDVVKPIATNALNIVKKGYKKYANPLLARLMLDTGSSLTERVVNLSERLEEKIELGVWPKGQFYVAKRVPENISDKELEKYGGVAVNPHRLAATGAVVGAGVVGNRLIKRGGGYRKVAGMGVDSLKKSYKYANPFLRRAMGLSADLTETVELGKGGLRPDPTPVSGMMKLAARSQTSKTIMPRPRVKPGMGAHAKKGTKSLAKSRMTLHRRNKARKVS